MTELDRILEEQRRCRDLILAGCESATEDEGLRGGLFDWVAEEVLMTTEAPD